MLLRATWGLPTSLPRCWTWTGYTSCTLRGLYGTGTANRGRTMTTNWATTCFSTTLSRTLRTPSVPSSGDLLCDTNDQSQAVFGCSDTSSVETTIQTKTSWATRKIRMDGFTQQQVLHALYFNQLPRGWFVHLRRSASAAASTVASSTSSIAAPAAASWKPPLVPSLSPTPSPPPPQTPPSAPLSPSSPPTPLLPPPTPPPPPPSPHPPEPSPPPPPQPLPPEEAQEEDNTGVVVGVASGAGIVGVGAIVWFVAATYF